MDLSKLVGTKLTTEQYLDAIRQLVQLLRLGEADESEFRELAPTSAERIADFFHPTVAPGLFYELSLLEHVCAFLRLAGLEPHMQEILDSGRLFEAKLTDMEVEPPEWLLAEGGEAQSSLMFSALYTFLKSASAIKATSYSINYFIEKGHDGDRGALKQAVRLDTCAITAPTVAAEIMKSDVLDKGKFRKDLQSALRYPHRVDKVNHGILRFVLRTMHEDGMLDQLSEKDRYEFFCVELGLYPDKSDEAFDSLNRFIRGCVSSFRT